jgi:hypothetical protein
MTQPADTRELVQTIAQQLGETQRGPIQQIRRVVQHLGADTAQAILAEAQQIEANGGLLLPDGSRRRTPGGVYFHLVRQRISPAERVLIFPMRPGRSTRPGTSVPAAPPTPVPASTEPQDIVIPNATGEARTVKITVIGRPGRIVRDPRGFVTVTMQRTGVPALPKGVPAPPMAPTSHTIYIAQKQWQKVADALQDPEDVLIVEGFPTATPQGINVYATNTTTKKLQQAQRATQQAQG